MSDYIVSARKYRPKTFDSVVGQDALVKTLKNAITSGKLAHAYLFCGPRGVGKTTCARIFAKTINCEHRTADGEACNECESCQAFNEQRSYNVYELDAASNNGVDQIRELVDQVKIPPQVGKYKVFIIDEVHMLSTSAFNAFLKTLEEPPAHAVFVMATTEKQKILPTILSRCQTYDFQRISNQDIVAQLARIAAKEGITAEPQALQIIARKADGGMRDALSIFDQIASFSGGNITYQATINNLNILDYELFFRLTDAAIQGNIPAALMMLDNVIRKGFDPQYFIGGWASHIRDLMVSSNAATLSLVEAGQEVAYKYQEQSTKCSPQFLYHGLQIANECDFNYRNSRNKRLSVEIAICRICQLMNPIGPAPAGPQPLQSVRTQTQPVQQPVQQTPHQPVAPQQAPAPTARPVVQTAPQPAAAPVKQPVATPASQPSAALQPQVQPRTVQQPTRRMVSIRSANLHAQQTSGTSVAATGSGEEKQDQAVDPTQLISYWKKFAIDNPDEKLIMSVIDQFNPQPISPDNTKYLVRLSSEDQLSIITEKKDKILTYLRKNVSNSKIMLTFEVSVSRQTRTMYTPRERFQTMNAEHPDEIALLSEKFHLELM